MNSKEQTGQTARQTATVLTFTRVVQGYATVFIVFQVSTVGGQKPEPEPACPTRVASYISSADALCGLGRVRID
jgi:hypothetical protein